MSYSCSDFYSDVMGAASEAAARAGVEFQPTEDEGNPEADARAVMFVLRRMAAMLNGGTPDARPTYEFEAVRYYGVGERYNIGAGLQFTTKNRREAYEALSAYAERAELYACEVRQFAGDGTEPRVLARSGPPMTVAKATSARAYRERQDAERLWAMPKPRTWKVEP